MVTQYNENDLYIKITNDDTRTEYYRDGEGKDTLYLDGITKNKIVSCEINDGQLIIKTDYKTIVIKNYSV